MIDLDEGNVGSASTCATLLGGSRPRPSGAAELLSDLRCKSSRVSRGERVGLFGTGDRLRSLLAHCFSYHDAFSRDHHSEAMARRRGYSVPSGGEVFHRGVVVWLWLEVLSSRPARVPEPTGEHHEHADTSNHTHHPDPSGWRRLLWPGALVLGYGLQRTDFEPLVELPGLEDVDKPCFVALHGDNVVHNAVLYE